MGQLLSRKGVRVGPPASAVRRQGRASADGPREPAAGGAPGPGASRAATGKAARAPGSWDRPTRTVASPDGARRPAFMTVRTREPHDGTSKATVSPLNSQLSPSESPAAGLLRTPRLSQEAAAGGHGSVRLHEFVRPATPGPRGATKQSCPHNKGAATPPAIWGGRSDLRSYMGTGTLCVCVCVRATR